MNGRLFRFENIDDDLPLLPLAARRALDVVGRRLSLEGWKSMSLDDRRVLVTQGSAPQVDAEQVLSAIARATPPAEGQECDDESGLVELPAKLSGTIDEEAWDTLSPLERFALRHLCRRNRDDALTAAVREIVDGPCLTHLTEHGDAHMVNVGDKPITHRRALASAVVRMRPETAQLVVDNSGPKGDVLAAARIAGIMAAKRTAELIPLCHNISLTRVHLSFDVDVPRGNVYVKAAVDAHDRTGVEMEAMVAASIASLTIYDMLKAVERGITIEQVVLLEKAGGRSGLYRRDPDDTEDDT